MAAKLGKYARGWLSTKVDEDGFRVIRKKTKANDQVGISRKQRWHGLVGSDILADTNRGPVEITAEDEQDAEGTTCPNSMFSASSGKPSLTQEELRSITDDRPSYPSMSPAKFHGAGLRWQAFLLSQSWDTMVAAWMSVLARPGWLIKHTTWSRAHMILASTPYYVIIWEYTLKSVEQKLVSWAPPQAHKSSPYRIVQITDLGKEWRVLPIAGVPPLKTQRLMGGGLDNYELTGQTGLKMTVLQAAARSGFVGVTVPYLAKLYREMKILGKRPTKEMDLVNVLLVNALPEASEAEIKALCAKRRAGETADLIESVLEEGQNMVFAEHVIPEEDRKEVKKAVNKHAAARAGTESESARAQQEGARATSSTDGVAQSAMEESQVGPRTKAFPRALGPGAPTLDWALTSLPQVRRCSITFDDSWHMRWKVSYPTLAPP